MKFLSESGLTYFLNKLKGLFITKTDFNKVYDNGVVDAKQIVHKTNSDNSENYDLTLGEREDLVHDAAVGSYVTIHSQQNKQGNIYINATTDNVDDKPSINVNAKGDVDVYSENNVQINGTNGVDIASNVNVDISASDDIRLTSNESSIQCNCQSFRINYDNYANAFNLRYNKGGTFGLYHGIDKFIHAETKDYNDDSDKVQFLSYIKNSITTAALDIRPTQIKCWTDAFSIKKDKEIKFKTSSSNSCRLTEGEGFKAFANMYAMPDNATDISEYTDEEKQLLANNTVQKLLLKFNSSKASAKVVNKIAKQTIHKPQVCIRKAISLGSAGHGVKYFHKNTPAIKLNASDGAYYKLMDTDGNVLTLGNKRNSHAESVGNGVYKITPEINEEGKIQIWSNLFSIAKQYEVPMFTEVVSVVPETINSLNVKVVTLRFTNASSFTGKTTSPYINILNGEPCGATCPNNLPGILIKNYLYFDKTMDRNPIQIFINKYCIYKKYGKKIGYRRRLYLGNRYMADKYSKALDKYSGIAMLVYYRKNIRIGTRNIYVSKQCHFRA